MLEKLMCKLGFHWWGYQSKKTGIYLHTYYDGSKPMSDRNYTNRRKCWDCGKKETWNNEE